jgi:cobalt/nickel transport system permease protein
MHHVVVERWSRGVSPLHARDARSKLGVVVVFLVALSTTRSGNWTAIACYATLLTLAAMASRLPVRSLIARSLLVLPFSATFALLTWWAGDPSRAVMLAVKAFLSALAALLLVATTPMTELAAALDILRVPRMLVLVIQFLYRYLFVISEQAQHMRLAALSRSGTGRGRRSRFHAAAGALGVLFVRSWERADGIYSAMLARGFRGRVHPITRPHFHVADYAFLALAASACIAIRIAL